MLNAWAPSLALVFGLSLPSSTLLAKESDQQSQAQVPNLSLPLYFEENRGQTDPSVRFVNRVGYSTTFFRDNDVVMRLPVSDQKHRDSAVVRMQFVDAHESVELEGNKQLPSHSNYFRGSDPDDWVSEVPHFAKLTYNDIYSGIDLVFHGVEGQLRYDFKVAPGADPAQIRLGFEGVESIVVADSGDLVLQTQADDVVHKAPLIYQDIDGIRHEVEGAFQIVDDEVGFRIGSYDKAYVLVIDPTIFYSTFLGGAGERTPYRFGRLNIIGQTCKVSVCRLPCSGVWFDMGVTPQKILNTSDNESRRKRGPVSNKNDSP